MAAAFRDCVQIPAGCGFFLPSPVRRTGSVAPIDVADKVYAGTRAQTLDDLMQTRNAPGALCSVAGKDAKSLGRDKDARDRKKASA